MTFCSCCRVELKSLTLYKSYVLQNFSREDFFFFNLSVLHKMHYKFPCSVQEHFWGLQTPYCDSPFPHNPLPPKQFLSTPSAVVLFICLTHTQFRPRRLLSHSPDVIPN